MKVKAIFVILLTGSSLPAFCQTFEEACKKINPVENQYATWVGVEQCHLKGAAGELYNLSGIIALNAACETKGTQYNATIGNNVIVDASVKETPKSGLFVTCWLPLK